MRSAINSPCAASTLAPNSPHRSRPLPHLLGRHAMSQTPRPRPVALTEQAVESLLQDTTPWLSCEECFERMDTYAEASVHDPQHRDEAMTAHLRGCAACDEEARSLIDLLRAR